MENRDLGARPSGQALVQAPSPAVSALTGFDPSRVRLTEGETQVYFLLRKYRVQKHYLATSAAKATRYAVFAHGGGQITEPTTSAEARTAADLLTAREIVSALDTADWEAGLRAFFNRDGVLEYISKGVRTAGWPMIDGEMMSWSDWLIRHIKEAAQGIVTEGGDATAAPVPQGLEPGAGTACAQPEGASS